MGDEASGKCTCKENVIGDKCTQCATEFWGLISNCEACMCNAEGSENNLCNVDSGHCYCKPNIGGDDCEKCIDGFFGFPTCQGCSCNEEGAVGNTCDDLSGKCNCRPTLLEIDATNALPDSMDTQTVN